MKTRRVMDFGKNQYKIEIINLDNGNKKIKTVKAENKENAMQIAVEGYAEWIVGMSTSTLREYYIKKKNILVKEPEMISQ